MVRVRLGAIITDLRGKLGGVYFRAGGSGLSMVTINSCRKRSIKQKNNSVFFSQINQSWLALSDAERVDWESYGLFCNFHQKNNSVRPLNGFSVFSSINYRRLLYSLAIITTAPVIASVPDACTLTLSVGATGLDLSASRSLDSDIEYIFISVSPAISPAVDDNSKLCRSLPLVTTSDSSWNINSLFVDQYGRSPVAGDTLAFKYCVCHLDSGLHTPFNYSQVTL